jgi:hypothetical protein
MGKPCLKIASAADFLQSWPPTGPDQQREPDPRGDGKAGPDAGSPLALGRKRLEGISSVAAGPCARVLSAGWNLHRDKTGFPSPKRRLGLEAACRRRLRVSPRYPAASRNGPRGWKGQAHRSPRHGGKLSGALVQAMPGPLLRLARGFAGRWPRIDDPIKLGRPWPQGGLPSRTLGTSTRGARRLSTPAGLAWHGAAAPRAGASPAWEPPLASLPLRDKH